MILAPKVKTQGMACEVDTGFPIGSCGKYPGRTSTVTKTIEAGRTVFPVSKFYFLNARVVDRHLRPHVIKYMSTPCFVPQPRS